MRWGGVRRGLKSLAYRSGALSAIHHRRNRDQLTVVTFHRVIGDGDPAWAEADPRYSVSARLFAQCLEFFREHYSPVGLDDVQAAARGARALPERPLLVTLDDGWRDNVQYALPALRAAGCPAIVFVTSGYVGAASPFWQPSLVGAWRGRRIAPEDLEAIWALAGADRSAASPDWGREEAIRDLIRRLTEMDGDRRGDLLRALDTAAEEPRTRAMMDAEELRLMEGGGVAVGAHGVTHERIAQAPDPWSELVVPRDDLAAALRSRPERISTMSFPHGSEDPRTRRIAREAGYELIFTNESCLNTLRDGRIVSDHLGRIGLPGAAISDRDGHLSPELLALWLFRRPRRVLRDGPEHG